MNNSAAPGPGQLLVCVKACCFTKIESEAVRNILGCGKEALVRQEVVGTVIACGCAVSRFSPENEIAAILPLTTETLEEQIKLTVLVEEFDAVLKPTSISPVVAAACLGPGLAAYSACHVQARVEAGCCAVLLATNTEEAGAVMMQLAAQTLAAADVKVFAACNNDDPKDIFKDVASCLSGRINFGLSQETFSAAVLEETMGIGAEVIIDNGVRQFGDHDLQYEQVKGNLPPKQQVIAALAVGGTWVTHTPSLQLDPEDSALLQLKAAGVCFANEFVWQLSRSRQDVYLHILHDVLEKLDNGSLKSVDYEVVSASEAVQALTHAANKRIVVVY